MGVVLFKHKKRGLAFTYDFESKTFRFKDYVYNTEKVFTLEEVLSFFWKEEDLTFDEEDGFKKRIEKVSGLIYVKGKLVPFDAKGVGKFIEIALQRAKVKNVTQEVKNELKSKLLSKLYKDFFLKKAIPTTATVKMLANQIVEQKFNSSFEKIKKFLTNSEKSSEVNSSEVKNSL